MRRRRKGKEPATDARGVKKHLKIPEYLSIVSCCLGLRPSQSSEQTGYYLLFWSVVAMDRQLSCSENNISLRSTESWSCSKTVTTYIQFECSDNKTKCICIIEKLGILFFLVLEIEPEASCMLSMCSTTNLYSKPQVEAFFFFQMRFCYVVMLVLNSWVQVILLPQSPKQLGQARTPN